MNGTTNTRTVVLGFTKDGERCILEWVPPRVDREVRLRYWRGEGMADPYNQDIHIALERITTSYERVSTPPDERSQP